MTPHTADRMPCPPDTWLQFDLGDGQVYVEQAKHIGWGPGEGPDGLGRVLAYQVLTPEAAALHA